jgi:hypothetical protein
MCREGLQVVISTSCSVKYFPLSCPWILKLDGPGTAWTSTTTCSHQESLVSINSPDLTALMRVELGKEGFPDAQGSLGP